MHRFLRVMLPSLALLSVLAPSPGADAEWQARAAAPTAVQTAVVDIDLGVARPLAPNFSGFNVNPLWRPWVYRDTRIAAAARRFDAGWLRFPAGTAGDAFDWRTGLVRDEWIARFDPDSDEVAKFHDYQRLASVKGPVLLGEFGALLRASGTSQAIICVNAFTDTPASARALARFVVANQIDVAYSELANEAHYFETFFRTGTDYARAMRPYADAIRSVIPGAKISLFYSGRKTPRDLAWDNALAAYPHQYWDALSFHLYRGRGVTFADAMPVLNAALADETTKLVRSYYLPRARPGTRVLVTEFNVNLGTTPSPTLHTLYNGIYVAELIARLSGEPRVAAVGVHQLVDNALGFGDDNLTRAFALADAGLTADTTTWDFKFFDHVPGLAVEIVNAAVNHSTATWRTTVSGGATVAAAGAPGRSIPALYAQAYRGDGRTYLLITNKSSEQHDVSVRSNGTRVAAPLQVTLIADPMPDATNTVDTPTRVTTQSYTSTNPISIPAYAVARISW